MRIFYIALIALLISPQSWGGNMVFNLLTLTLVETQTMARSY